MKIVITTVQAPFIKGGAEFLADNLKNALILEGHEAEIVTMPFMDNPIDVIEDHMLMARLMKVEHIWAGHSDLCIGLKFPAYYIPHSNKVVWALHQHRAAYDLFDTEFSNIKNTAQGNAIRNKIINADNIYLKEAKRIYTIADNVSNRMEKYNQISAQTLYHPCPDMDRLGCAEYENYILMPSRINITKRQMLAIESMCKVKSDLKLYIVGGADNVEETDKMLNFIKEKKLSNRIKYFNYVSQEEKIKLYANARAVLFIPLDEDYGYISLEALASSKAVITAKDSGGPLEFVENNKNGLIVDSTPDEIARAIDTFVSETQAKEWGRNSLKRLKDMNITWKNVVKELTK